MRTHTSGFTTALKTAGRQIDCSITYSTTTLDNTNLNSVKLNYETSLFKTIMKELEIDCNSTIAKGTTDVNCKIGVKVGSSYEYMDYGNYTIRDNPVYKADTKSYLITGYDKMLGSMIKFDDDPYNPTYPITVKDYLLGICTKLSWSNDLPATFPNYDTELTAELYAGLGLTYRDILDDLCPVIAGNLMFNVDDELVIITPNATSTTITDDYLSSLNVDLGTKYGPINSLVLSRSEDSDTINSRDETSITANGLTEYKIKDNFILSSDDRESFIDDIFTEINGLEYYLFDVDTLGLLVYDPMDTFTITNNSISYLVLLLGNEITLSQGLKENCHNSIPEETKTDYSTSSPTDKDIKTTTLIVNKQAGEIATLVQTTTDLSTTLAGEYTPTDVLEAQLDERDNEIIQTLSTQITETATDLQVSIIENINTNGVAKLTNTLVTIDIEGIKVAVNTSAFNTLLNNVGLFCQDGTTVVAQFDKDGALIKDLTVQGDINFPLITLTSYTDDDSEEGLGHFWNGG